MTNKAIAENSLSFWQKIFTLISKIGVTADDDDETRLQKLIIVLTSILISISAIIWGLIYILYGELVAGLIPLTYSAITILWILILRVSNMYPIFSFSQILMILLLPFFLMMVLGGFVNGSAVIVWAFFAPLASLLSGQSKRAVIWFFAFAILILLSASIQPYLRTENNLPDIVKTIFFTINIGTVSLVTFLVLLNFVKKKDSIIELMRKNRELEKSYLQQEVMLRQSEKLATLGKLSAGMAHELNNPAAVALRGSKQLQSIIIKLEKLLFDLGGMKLTEKQLDIFNIFNDKINSTDSEHEKLDPLVQSDREIETEAWLENQQIENPWDIASMFVRLNLTINDISILTEHFSGEELKAILSALHSMYVAHSLLDEIGQGTGRITDIVKSLKSYVYLDKAPVNAIDIHEGLNDTLIMLRSQLKNGIIIQKKYDDDLPKIQAYGSELNQVWTNIIDNAISAMNGKGEITIKTFQDDSWAVIQINNTGPEIPVEIQGKVFDPFFTTKPPGEGTGLGLNITHNIVVQKHKGEISLQSDEENTCFEIRLPIES